MFSTVTAKIYDSDDSFLEFFNSLEFSQVQVWRRRVKVVRTPAIASKECKAQRFSTIFSSFPQIFNLYRPKYQKQNKIHKSSNTITWSGSNFHYLDA